MSKRKKAKCPHPECEGGFIYERRDVSHLLQDATLSQHTRIATQAVTRHLCPLCQGLGQIRRKR